ncbi:MAG: hypothetical protein A3C47_00400 [Omnitrophica bacterium RIFCSPHIGHO2_02_FULL_51_18]|nr:MAG: hypothetical protein A3C47_00400 [Omnitrophica bacterium RIFCSPHIGHO2_02_FULL_51_18]
MREKSPYLLQHAQNPVDWRPWGDEAFEKAKREDKPVILSIGYSTCHWCHVMAHESFEDDATAAVMNERFISIKVDREERPDIDSIYMQYVMATTGGGGWPMTVFLTPDRKPFYGGTYFPPEDRYGMPGFKSLLSSISQAWKERRGEILESANSAATFLNQNKHIENPNVLGEKTLEASFERFSGSYDSRFGGFGSAPKFPMGHSLSFLLRYWKRTGDAHALDMVTHTLRSMASGGIYDKLSGGFHRYSTDTQWRVPHFEKMLYDQAILVRSFLEAYQATHDEAFARVARETLDYVLREMTDKKGGDSSTPADALVAGGFYSAQDADSQDPRDPSHKREGAYFVWRREELDEVLGEKDAEIFSYVYGVEKAGNALQDPHKEFMNQNVLYLAQNKEVTSKYFKRSVTEIDKIIADSRKKLLEHRAKRVPPHLDDKVLTDWNGLMIASFAFASRVLDEVKYLNAAESAAEFIRTTLTDKNGRLLHRYRGGEAAIQATLDDYAFLIYGYLNLYESSFDRRWLEESRKLFRMMVDEFWDAERGGFYLTSAGTKDLIARPKNSYDGAIPSGNSMAALTALLLSRFAADEAYEKYAAEIFQVFSDEVAAQPTGYSQMLSALDFAVGPSYEMVLSAVKQDETFESMLREIYLRFLPNKITLWNKEGGDKPPVDGKTTAYICKNKVCGLPITDLEEFKKQLI